MPGEIVTRIHVVHVQDYTWYTRVVRQYLAIEGGRLVHYIAPLAESSVPRVIGSTESYPSWSRTVPRVWAPACTRIAAVVTRLGEDSLATRTSPHDQHVCELSSFLSLTVSSLLSSFFLLLSSQIPLTLSLRAGGAIPQAFRRRTGDSR